MSWIEDNDYDINESTILLSEFYHEADSMDIKELLSHFATREFEVYSKNLPMWLYEMMHSIIKQSITKPLSKKQRNVLNKVYARYYLDGEYDPNDLTNEMLNG